MKMSQIEANFRELFKQLRKFPLGGWSPVGYSYATRAELLASSPPAIINNVSCVHGGVLCQYVRGTPADITLADGSTWTAAGPVYFQHCGAYCDGVTDDNTAAQLTLTNHSSIELIGNLAISGGISLIGKYIFGCGRQACSIIGLASLAVSTPLVSLAQQSGISSLTLAYTPAAIALTEVEGQRILLNLGSGATNASRGTSVTDITFRDSGTAIYSDTTPFNVSLRNLYIQGYSFRGWDAPLGTGNTIEGQFYIEGYATAFPAHRADCALNIEKATGKENSGTAINITQLNIHLARVNGPLIRADSITNLTIGATHLENSAMYADNMGLVHAIKSSITFLSLNMQSLGFNTVNPSLFLLGDAGYPVAAGTSQTDKSTITVQRWTCRGLNNPSAILGTWTPTGVRVLNFLYARRVAGALGTYNFIFPEPSQWSVYPLDDNADETDMLNGVWRLFDPAVKLRQSPLRNWVSNATFENWTATTGTSTGAAAVEIATGWNVIALGAAQLTGERISRVAGNGRETYGIRVNNIGFTGNTCFLQHKIPAVLPLSGQVVTLSFEAFAAVAGQQLEDIIMSLDNGAGTPASTFFRVKFGNNYRLQFDTTLKRYEFTFTLPTYTVLDPAAFWNLLFRLNVGAGTLSGTFSIFNVAVQLGNFATRDLDPINATQSGISNPLGSWFA
jgi:hypothetical protein